MIEEGQHGRNRVGEGMGRKCTTQSHSKSGGLCSEGQELPQARPTTQTSPAWACFSWRRRGEGSRGAGGQSTSSACSATRRCGRAPARPPGAGAPAASGRARPCSPASAPAAGEQKSCRPEAAVTEAPLTCPTQAGGSRAGPWRVAARFCGLAQRWRALPCGCRSCDPGSAWP